MAQRPTVTQMSRKFESHAFTCDLGLENAALGLRPRAVFSRPRSQFFTTRTSQPANNIYLSVIEQACGHGTARYLRRQDIVQYRILC